ALVPYIQERRAFNYDFDTAVHRWGTSWNWGQGLDITQPLIQTYAFAGAPVEVTFAPSAVSVASSGKEARLQSRLVSKTQKLYQAHAAMLRAGDWALNTQIESLQKDIERLTKKYAYEEGLARHGVSASRVERAKLHVLGVLGLGEKANIKNDIYAERVANAKAALTKNSAKQAQVKGIQNTDQFKAYLQDEYGLDESSLAGLPSGEKEIKAFKKMEQKKLKTEAKQLKGIAKGKISLKNFFANDYKERMQLVSGLSGILAES
ncbi:MAG: hypothetical protein ACYDEQ_12120, partial [Desulfocucumaceae bacterium]